MNPYNFSEFAYEKNKIKIKFLTLSEAKAKYFVYRCKKYILQFLIIKPSVSLIMLIAEIFEETQFTVLNYFYASFIILFFS